MVYKIFLDVNILLDYFIADRENHIIAVALFEEIEQNKIDAYISESVINTTIFLLQKHISANKLRQLFDELLTYCNILQCYTNTLRKAFLINFNDIEDAIIYQVALENEMNFFISNDRDLQKKLSTKVLPVINAKAFLNKLN